MSLILLLIIHGEGLGAQVMLIIFLCIFYLSAIYS